MSLPDFPTTPPISREEAISQVIASIALEELGLSHIINAEGEKLQYALGTLADTTGPLEPSTIEEILKVNDSITKTVESIRQVQMVLRDKLKDALSAEVLRGPTGPAGPAGPAATCHMMIPFASTIAPLSYANNENPTAVSLIGFGYGDNRANTPGDDYSIIIDETDGSFDLNTISDNSNKQLAFSLPFNLVLKSIYITVGNYKDIDPVGEVFPYVQLYKAEQGDNHFVPIPGAVAVPEKGIGPGTTVPADTMCYASTDKLKIKLTAGTRIAIGGLMKIMGDTDPVEYLLYYTGGIGFLCDSKP